MNLRFLTQRRVLVLVIVALGVSSFLKPGAAGAISKLPRNVVAKIVGMASEPVKAVADAIRRRPAEAVDHGAPADLTRYYDQLLRDNEQLRQAISQIQRELDNVRRFRREGGMESVNPVSAGVTAWQTDGTRETLTLNRGGRHGIQPGQAVLDWYNFSLVGRVSDAGVGGATVTLSTSSALRLNVRFRPSTSVRLVYEPKVYLLNPADRRGEFTLLIKAEDAEFIRPGYLAHLADDTWPREAAGTVVGKVVSVTPWPQNPLLNRVVTVRPIHDLRRLGEVVVLVPIEVPVGGGAGTRSGGAGSGGTGSGGGR